MGCLLPWCILERAIIFPLRLHFTRQINQALVQQPFPVSGWESLVQGSKKIDQIKCQVSPGLPHDITAHGPAEISPVQEDEMRLLEVTSISLLIFFLFQSFDFLFSVLHWSCFSPDGALAEKSSTAQQCPHLPLTFPILITNKLFLNLEKKKKKKVEVEYPAEP